MVGDDVGDVGEEKTGRVMGGSLARRVSQGQGNSRLLFFFFLFSSSTCLCIPHLFNPSVCFPTHQVPDSLRLETQPHSVVG